MNKYDLISPVKSGIVETNEWELMEKLWHRSLF